MSKAVLVLDGIPESCDDCKLYDSFYHGCRACGIEWNDEWRPDWCPLKDLFKELEGCRICESDAKIAEKEEPEWLRGWNECIDTMEMYI